jgi:hypothetical protein
MTRQVEHALNLPRLEDALGEFSDAIPNLNKTNEKVDKMAAALEKLSPSMVGQGVDEEGTTTHAQEMDEIYSQALKAHKEMLDLGYNVESRHAGNILEPAARFLEIAMNASKSKSEQKLKTLKLRLEKRKIDHELGENVSNGMIDSNDPNSFIADRNELLKDLVGKLKETKVKKK